MIMNLVPMIVDKELDGESVFKDIPLEELSFYNDTCLYPSSQYSSL